MYENIIVIPFRNRERHLDYFIKNSVPLLQEHLPNSKVVVIEQNEGKLFNRGALLNVGFKEYENKTKYFLTHDVDINPTKKYIEEHYKKEVNDTDVLGIYTSKCNTLGGIIKIKDSTIHNINGFPNDIWGWGTEDKALQNRSEFYNIQKITNLTDSVNHPLYLHRFDDVDDREWTYTTKNTDKHYIKFTTLNSKQKFQELISSGLNNLNYIILNRKMIHDMVELIKVEI
jgi:beta-1,4-galactosyltransferase 1